MSIETHIVSDDPGPYQVRLIVGPPLELDDDEHYVACIYTRDENGYETGVNIDADDAQRLVHAIVAEAKVNDVALSPW